MIAQLAERISGGMYFGDKEFRLEQLKEWRTDPFKFAAFKVAVGKLLDALRPPERENGLSAAEYAAIKERAQKEGAKLDMEKFGLTPEFVEFINEVHRTPEAYGGYTFGTLWVQLTRTNPLTEVEKRLHDRRPHYGETVEREFYGFQKARRDLGIDKSKSERGVEYGEHSQT